MLRHVWRITCDTCDRTHDYFMADGIQAAKKTDGWIRHERKDYCLACGIPRRPIRYLSDDIPGEEWRDYQARGYQVSSFGRVRRRDNGLILRAWKDNNGFRVKLFPGNSKEIHRYVHRMVAETFLDIDQRVDVVFIDGDRHNAVLSNIALVPRLPPWEKARRAGKKRGKTEKVPKPKPKLVAREPMPAVPLVVSSPWLLAREWEKNRLMPSSVSIKKVQSNHLVYDQGSLA